MEVGYEEFSEIVKDVRVGKQILLELNCDDEDKAKDQVAQMCEKLLANTVIEDYDIQIIK